MLNSILSNPDHGIDTRFFSRFGLDFVFFNNDGTSIIITLPFYENPKISENKRANYVKLSPLASNENIFIYTGSESRRIKIDLDINFLHMANNNLYGLKTMRKKIKFYDSEPKINLIEKWDAYIDEQIGVIPKDFDVNIEPYEDIQNNSELLECYHFFLEVLKQGTHNNKKNPILGPPVVVIKFAPLYDNVPCICENYSLKNKDITYDVETGLPLNMSISLDLTELRNTEMAAAIPKIESTTQTKPDGSVETTHSKNVSLETNLSQPSFKLSYGDKGAGLSNSIDEFINSYYPEEAQQVTGQGNSIQSNAPTSSPTKPKTTAEVKTTRTISYEERGMTINEARARLGLAQKVLQYRKDNPNKNKDVQLAVIEMEEKNIEMLENLIKGLSSRKGQ